jgi:phosphatidylserine/phosphatidylglycerophosphate/cardiolipin synthase-like enzyme
LFRTYVGRHSGAYIEERLIAAKNAVKICSPWVSPYHARIIDSLIRRKVIVKLLISDRPYFSNTQNEDSNNRGDTLEILRGIKKSFKDFLDMPVKDMAKPPLSYKIVKSSLIHAKLYIVDGTYGVGGSANLTQYGQSKNVEHIFYTEDPADVEQLSNDFEKIWSSYTEPEIVEDSTSVLQDAVKDLKKVAGKFKK